ncbi:MAG: phospholipase D-like domain-containing protein, partial [Vicinamibacterales bacterium]
MRKSSSHEHGSLCGVVLPTPARAQAVERLCDPAFEDCRQVLINYIRAEKAGLDVAFWFMEDSWIASEVINRHKAGVPVRVLVDPRANASTPRNADRLAELEAAGIPMRQKVSSGILHWKMMLFAGQNIVEFSGANFSSDAWVYSGAPYTNYVDEAIYFTSDSSVVNSFRTKFDDLWIDTSRYANYANISGPLTRNYGIFSKDPELNFPPFESFANRSVDHYNLERQKLDVIIYRITDQRHTNAVINAVQRGIPVRLITEPEQYRDPKRLWHSWNVDRLYMAGVQIRHRVHAGLNHQKLTLYYSQGISVLGSSNWTSPSDNSQEEHNYFTVKPHLFTWLVDHFERKWNNTTGIAETGPFAPLPPDAATTPFPADSAQGIPAASVTLEWQAGYWAHNYDIYFGTSPQPPLLAANQMLGPSQSPTDYRRYTVPASLQTGTTYYWRIVSKTMADMTASSPVFTFSTEGSAPPPPPPGATDVVLHAGKGTRAGAWQSEADATAASGVKMRHPDAGAAKITTASASPANYFDMTFSAEAGVPYRLWLRGRADANYWPNDSAFVQFSGSVDASGSPVWRIGTTSATDVSLEECSGCGVSNWGWQDNGWGAGVLGPLVYFATTGTHTVRVQTREDGLAIDQIVLSPSTYLSTPPGPNKNDSTILPEQGGSGGTVPPPGDTTAPTAQITSPSGGATVSGTANVAVSAGDNVAVARVEMLLDGALA